MLNFFYKSVIALALFASTNIIAQNTSNKPVLDNKDSWSLILIPDIQNYVKYNRNQPILELMTKWIATNADSLNVKMVMCVGDLVEQNDIINNGHDGDQTGQKQWEAAARAFGHLDGIVPYITATGNHDYSINRSGQRTTRYDEFFPIDKNLLNRKIIVQNGVDEYENPTLANAAYELKINDKDYLFLNLEYAPRDATLDWANKIVKFDQYKNHRVILMTHSYMNKNDKRLNNDSSWIIFEPYSINNKIQKSPRIKLPNANNGEQIWNKLVKPNHNIELVLSGHVFGEGYRVDKNDNNKNVHQMLFDMQSEGGGHRNGNGGDGWLRILEFYPDNKTVKVKTYSPLFGISPKTENISFKKDARNDFEIKFTN